MSPASLVLLLVGASCRRLAADVARFKWCSTIEHASERVGQCVVAAEACDRAAARLVGRNEPWDGGWWGCEAVSWCWLCVHADGHEGGHAYACL